MSFEVMDDNDEDWKACSRHPVSHVALQQAKDLQFLRPGIATGGCSQWLSLLKCGQCRKSWFGCRLCHWKSPLLGTVPRNSNLSASEMMGPVCEHSISPLHAMNLAGHRHDIRGTTSIVDNGNGTQTEPDDVSTGGLSVFNETSLPSPGAEELDPDFTRIQSVFDDVDQSKLRTLNIMESLQSKPLRDYLQLEERGHLMGCRANVTNALKEDRLREVVPHVSNVVTVEGAHFMNTCAQVYSHLSVADRHRFNWILNSLHNIPRDDWHDKMGPVSIPTSDTEAARVYQTGVHSILETQPTPKLGIVATERADGTKEELVVAEPRDILQFLFSVLPMDVLEEMIVVDKATTVPDPPERVSSYFESKSFLDDLKKVASDVKDSHEVAATIVLAYKLWSDAWDPDSTKQNRNGIWCLVWTIMVGNRDYVFPVAIGAKGHDHHPALRAFLSKLDALGEYPIFRHTASGKNLRVRLVFGLYNVDRLEKGELWSGQHHAALRCKCFRVVYGFTGGYHPRYAACESCLSQVVSKLCSTSSAAQAPPDGGLSDSLCMDCACYNPVPSASHAQVTAGPVPPELRRVIPLTDDSSLCIPPPGRSMGASSEPYACVHVSQDFLVSAAQYVVYQTWKGAITKKKTFLLWTDACGIGKKLGTKLFEVAEFHRKEGTTEFCDVFQPGLLPPTWTHPSMSILKFLNAPMHLLFLGIVSKVADMMDVWFSLRGLKKSLSEHVSQTCDSLGKLGLQWLLLRKFGVTVLSRGSWVSEQYVAFSKVVLIPYAGLVFTTHAPRRQIRIVLRVLDSCSCVLSLLMQRSVTDTTAERATLAITAYLSAIDALGKVIFDTKTKRASKKRKAATVAVGSAAPSDAGSQKRQRNSVVLETSTAVTADSAALPVEHDGIIESTVATDEDNGAINAAIESSVAAATNSAALQETLLEGKGIPISLSNPNHASLTLVPFSIKSHGPPVDQWEGKDGCEKSIQGMKRFFHGVCVVDGGQMAAAFERYYRSLVIDQTNELLALRSSLVSQDNIVASRQRFTDTKRYSNLAEVRILLQKIEPITAFLFQVESQGSSSMVICVATRPRATSTQEGGDTLHRLLLTEATPLTMDEDLSFAADFLTFCKVAVDDTNSGTFNQHAPGVSLVTPLILIPGRCVWRDQAYSSRVEFPFDSKYTVATDNYSCLQADLLVHQKVSLTDSLWLQSGELIDEDDSSEFDWMSCNVSELRAELTRRAAIRRGLGMSRLAVSGNKSELASRLAEDDKLSYLGEFEGSAGTAIVPGEFLNDSGIWGKKTTAELKAEIRKRNEQRTAAGESKLLLGGKKDDLIRRLITDDAATSDEVQAIIATTNV